MRLLLVVFWSRLMFGRGVSVGGMKNILLMILILLCDGYCRCAGQLLNVSSVLMVHFYLLERDSLNVFLNSSNSYFKPVIVPLTIYSCSSGMLADLKSPYASKLSTLCSIANLCSVDFSFVA